MKPSLVLRRSYVHARRERPVSSLGCRGHSHRSDLCVPRCVILRCPRKLTLEPNNGRFGQIISMGKAIEKEGRDHANCTFCGTFTRRNNATIVSTDAERTRTR